MHLALALAAAVSLPAPSRPALDTAYLAGGCFWGVEAVFEHVKGVVDVVSGYSGGTLKNPSYEVVSAGVSGHAEAVRVVFDPAAISYAELLRVFFTVAHDPTQLNRQGPDVGTQYRSAVFYASPEQERVVRGTIASLAQSKGYRAAIVTQVLPLDAWYDAEKYHQDFAAKNPDHPCIVYHDAPKVARLKR
jgi:peptide-methionine (S)-S-oxide reductase